MDNLSRAQVKLIVFGNRFSLNNSGMWNLNIGSNLLVILVLVVRSHIPEKQTFLEIHTVKGGPSVIISVWCNASFNNFFFFTDGTARSAVLFNPTASLHSVVK